jgi:hypothetical protein
MENARNPAKGRLAWPFLLRKYALIDGATVWQYDFEVLFSAVRKER